MSATNIKIRQCKRRRSMPEDCASASKGALALHLFLTCMQDVPLANVSASATFTSLSRLHPLQPQASLNRFCSRHLQGQTFGASEFSALTPESPFLRLAPSTARFPDPWSYLHSFSVYAVYLPNVLIVWTLFGQAKVAISPLSSSFVQCTLFGSCLCKIEHTQCPSNSFFSGCTCLDFFPSLWELAPLQIQQ